jgi:hypothetical protein
LSVPHQETVRLKFPSGFGSSISAPLTARSKPSPPTFVIVMRWKDARLAHTGTGVAHYGLDQIWTPRTGIANETSSVVRKLPESAQVEPDGTVLYRQRYVGSFTQPLRLRSFPFDRQTFHVQLAAVRYRPNEVRFVPDEESVRNGIKDGAGIAPSITLPDWTIEK